VIPKNTLFTGALREMMRDPEYFENPTEFLPERYMKHLTKMFIEKYYFPTKVLKRQMRIAM